MNTNGDESHGFQFFRSRDRRLLRKIGQLLDLARYGEDEKARVIAAVERELPTLREEATEGGGA
jgi:hypothetical protein